MEIEKNKKQIRIIWWAFIVVSYLMLGMFSAKYSLPATTRNILFWGLFVIFMLSWYVINQCWYKEVLKKINSLEPILEDEKNPDKYIAENLSLLEGKKGWQIIAILNMNIAEGYCAKGDYSKAKLYLMNINEKKIHGALKVYYWIILMYVLFYLEERDVALAMFEKKQQEVLKFAKAPGISEISSVVLVFSFLAKEQWEDAKTMLSKAEEEGKMRERDICYLRTLF